MPETIASTSITMRDRNKTRMSQLTRAPAFLPILCAIALGLLLDFHPMLLSSLGRVQGDTIDSRDVNYFLEHSYRWAGSPVNRSFWDAPIFYPAPNNTAFGDVLIGAMPAYAPWRLLRFDADTAFQIWILAVCVLNFLSFYVLLRTCLSFAVIPSCLGAFLFSFGAPRVGQSIHQQLLPQFYLVICTYALIMLFRPERHRSHWWVVLFFCSLTLQIWSGFYCSWFLLFSLGIALVWTLLLPSFRRPFWTAVRQQWIWIICLGAVCIVVVSPLAIHYLRAAKEIGFRSFKEISFSLPTPRSWLYLGPDSWLYGWTAKWPFFESIAPLEHEQRLGLGLLTTAVALAGLFRRRHARPVALMILISASLLLISVKVQSLSLWKVVFLYVPGGNAIRAVSRAGLFFLFPLSIGFASFFELLLRNKRLRIAGLLAFLCFIEQGENAPSFDKYRIRADVQTLAARVRPECAAFLYAPTGKGQPEYRYTGRIPSAYKYHMDAMWANFENHVPTIDGYAGNVPKGWEFYNTDERRLDEALTEWCKRMKLDRAKVCWLR